MKKIFLFISPLIAFFLGGFILTFRCSAQAMPTPTANTFSTITNANNSLSFSLFSNVDVLPINSNPVDLYRIIENVAKDPLVVGTQLNLMGNNDYTVTNLTQSEIDQYANVYPYLYDVNGNTVSWDNIYHLHYMNAMFHGDAYIDGNGNILTSDQNRTRTMFQLGIGGALLNATDVANIYNDIVFELNANEFVYPIDGQLTSSSYYITLGRKASNFYIVDQLYIPDIYSTDFYVVNTSYNQTLNKYLPQGIYCNNDSPFYINHIVSSPNDILISVYSGNYNVNGVTYNRLISLSDNALQSSGFILPSEVQSANQGFYICGFNDFNYDSNITRSESFAFKKVNIPSTKQIQFDDDYDYNYIQQLETSLNNLTSSVNELFDPEQVINEYNYPLNNELPQNAPDATPSELPFPSQNVNPSPDPVPMPDPETAPSIGSDIGEVDPTELRSTIPIINNLLNRFPFSIPWDIYGLLSGLSVQRETPYINTTIHIPGIDYDWVLDYDLSDFNSIASLFRTLFLIAFILGLAYFSYDHFFGS